MNAHDESEGSGASASTESLEAFIRANSPHAPLEDLKWLPWAALFLGLLLLVIWLLQGPPWHLVPRVPGADRAPNTESTVGTNAVLAGRLIKGIGLPGTASGLWPGFGGMSRIAGGVETKARPAHVRIARSWTAAQPRELWSVDVGEGYAGPAVIDGRVYLIDYDHERKQDAIRCLSLDDGKEIWRY